MGMKHGISDQPLFDFLGPLLLSSAPPRPAPPQRAFLCFVSAFHLLRWLLTTSLPWSTFIEHGKVSISDSFDPLYFNTCFWWLVIPPHSWLVYCRQMFLPNNPSQLALLTQYWHLAVVECHYAIHIVPLVWLTWNWTCSEYCIFPVKFKKLKVWKCFKHTGQTPRYRTMWVLWLFFSLSIFNSSS